MPDSPRALDAFSADWIVLVLLVCVGTLGWINLVSPKKWRLITRSIFSFRLGRQSMRDDIDPQDRTLIAMVIMASAVIALFAFQFAVRLDVVPANFGWWARIFGSALGLLLLQVVLLRGMVLLFQGDGGLTEYTFTLLLLHVAVGIALLPVVGVMAYPHHIAWRAWAAWAGVGIVAAATVFRWLRALVVGVGSGVPVRYIFIYLCALEILPVALALHETQRALPATSH